MCESVLGVDVQGQFRVFWVPALLRQDSKIWGLEVFLEFTGRPKSLSKVKAHSPFIDDLEPVAPLDAVAVLGTAQSKTEAVSKYSAIAGIFASRLRSSAPYRGEAK